MNAKTTNKTPRTPITIRRANAGYQVSSRRTCCFRGYNQAFEAAWSDCRRDNRPLAAITPDGHITPLLGAKMIREYHAND